MNDWKSTKAKRLLSALERLDWRVKWQTGSHELRERPGRPEVVFAFHDDEETGPKMLARMAKVTGLKPEDL